MKTRIALIPLISLLLLSFKPSNEVSTEAILKDYWLLEKVSYVEPDMYDRIILFNDVTNFCFEQSLWRFSPTSNTGTYDINDLYCSYGKRDLSFNIQKTNQKTGLYDVILKTENKSKYGNLFKIKVTELKKNKMQWRYKVFVNGKPYTIQMHFIRK
ncbi:hypothetical protein ACFS5M_01680 [Lacinutrix iliipiscaria]|uniref:Lipocalin-like domain-containing protein n=1 Tax=Lacinutrix iliipiscaria TaxID=1230532 RepID=A0ABW5WK89_9FLAO